MWAAPFSLVYTGNLCCIVAVVPSPPHHRTEPPCPREGIGGHYPTKIDNRSQQTWVPPKSRKPEVIVQPLEVHGAHRPGEIEFQC